MHDDFEALVLDRLLDQTGMAAVLKEQVTALREELSLAENALLEHTKTILNQQKTIADNDQIHNELVSLVSEHVAYRKKQEAACGDLYLAAERMNELIRNSPAKNRSIELSNAISTLHNGLAKAHEYCDQIPF